MDLDLIESFMAVADSLSFSEAAKRIGLTQPSISRQIQTLEDIVKTKLFIRDQHHVLLTNEGKEFKSRFAPLLDEFKGTISSFQQTSMSTEGNISVGCLPEVGQNFFHRLFLDYQKEKPGIRFHIHYGLQTNTVQLLKAGDLDFTIVWHPQLTENVRSYHLLEERSVLVTRTSNQKPLTDMETARFVAYEKRDVLLFQYLKLHFPKKKTIVLKEFSCVNSQQSMVQALLLQDAYAVLPLFTVEPYLKTKELRIASPLEVKNDLYLLHLENQMLTRRALEFKKYLLERCRSLSLVSGSYA